MKQRCLDGLTLSAGSRGQTFLASSDFPWLLTIFNIPWLLIAYLQSWHHPHMAFLPVCVCVFTWPYFFLFGKRIIFLL